MLSFDHLVIAGPSLAELSSMVHEATGVTATPGGPHIGLGTANELIGVDSTSYIELIGPDINQPEPAVPRPFGIGTLDGPSLRTWALAVKDLETARSATASAGLTPGDAVSMSRRRPDGTLLEWSLANPLEEALAGILPFLISWGATEHPAASLAPSLEVLNFELTHPDPKPIEAAVAAISGQELSIATGPAHLSVTLRGPGGDLTL